MKYLLLLFTIFFSVQFGLSQDERLSDTDMVITKDMTKISCNVIEVTKKFVEIQVGSTSLKLKKSDVHSVIVSGVQISLLKESTDSFVRPETQTNSDLKQVTQFENEEFYFSLLDTIGPSNEEIKNVLTKDIVILKDRTQISGQILELKKNSITIRVGGEPVVIRKKNIKHIFYKGERVAFFTEEPENAKTDTILLTNESLFELVPIKKTEKRGFYNITYGSIGLGGDGGIGVENVSGFQLNQYSGLGLGVGYQDFDLGYFRSVGKIVPVFAEYRGYLNAGKVSAYYNLAFGASFGTKNENSFYQSTSPGTYFAPAIGYKCGSEKASFMIDLSVRFASITYQYDGGSGYYYYYGPSRGMYEEKYSIRQLMLRIGIML